jgi:excinuclease ABC subunit C
MDAKWLDQFQDFGSDALLSHPSLAMHASAIQRLDGPHESAEQCKQSLKSGILERVPRTPGVYGMIDAVGRLLYVGKSKLLRNRLLSYFLPGSKDEKAGRILQHARSIVWETQPSEFAALLREQSLIRRWQPRLNVIGMPKRQQSAFLCLGRGPAEQFYVARQWDPTATSCHGPFFGANQLFRAVEVLNRFYLLRDCSQKTPTHLSNQLTLFPIESRPGCLRAELGTCLAPCQQGVSSHRYAEQETRAQEFLQGDPHNMLEWLERDMNLAASRLHFERALRLREDLRIVRWLTKKLNQHRVASEGPPTLYWEPLASAPSSNDSHRSDALPVQPSGGVLYFLQRGGIEYAVGTPRNERQWTSIRKEISRWLASSDRLDTRYCQPKDSLGLVSAWFQKNPRLKSRLLPIQSPNALEKSWSELSNHWRQAIEA